MFHVQAAYPCDEDFSIDAAAIEAAGRPADYSGFGSSWAGCGFRDLGWTFENAAHAIALHKKLSSVFGLTVRVRDELPQAQESP